MQPLIVGPSKNMKSEIRSTEAMNSDNINDAETLATSTASDTKLMERMTYMSLKRANGKPGKYVRT